jgi:DNA-binding transcriptional LysR family regulator
MTYILCKMIRRRSEAMPGRPVLTCWIYFRSKSGEMCALTRVSGPPTFLSQFLAPRLLPLRGEHPRLRIELIGEAHQISLSQGEADLALRMVRPHEKGVVARRLAVVAYELYGSRDYLADCGEDARDFLGDDDSFDHLPQQRWLC